MHYIDVAPLRRVPWGLKLFTYAAEDAVELGSLVQCRFGGQIVGAIAWSARSAPPAGIAPRPIASVLQPGWLTQPQMRLFDWVCEAYATPLPTLLYLYSLSPVIRRRKGDIEILEPATSDHSWVGKSSLVVEASPAADAAAAADIAAAWGEASRPALVLCPTHNDAQRVAQLCDGLVYTQNLTRSQKSAAWRSILNGEVATVVGTAAAAFLPFSCLGGVVAYREADPAAKAIESRPLLHLRSLAIQLARIHSCPLGLVDFAPSPAAAYLAQAGGARVVRRGGMPSYAGFLTLAKPSLLASPKFREDLQVAVSAGRALVLVPRLGSAGLLCCGDCAHVFACPTCDRSFGVSIGKQLRCSYCGRIEQIPAACPRCSGVNLRERRWTVGSVSECLRSLLPDVGVGTFEASSRHVPSSPIVVSTVAALYRLPLGSFSLRVALDFDTVLQQPTLEGTSRAYRMLRQLCASGPTLVETRSPEHRAFSTLGTWESFSRAELAERRTFKLPPVGTTIKFATDGQSRAEVQQRANQLVSTLSALSWLEVTRDLDVPGRSVRRQFRHVVTALAHGSHALELIPSVDYSQWTIDPDPTDFL